MQTLQHIPLWVFVLFLALVASGLVHTRTRHIPKRRLLSINIALTVFTLVGVVQQWLHTPWLALGLISWAATGLLVTWVLGRSASPADASYDPITQRFTVPGSWLPLALFMTIFACKFVVGMLTALVPEALNSLNVAIGISALYGLLSGLLNAKAFRLLQLSKRHSPNTP
jgi:UDP-N-acetylmuramyl pentapeptide phosphotransferase/UDP-N-acetylglucosamine-1-phosphate transferase